VPYLAFDYVSPGELVSVVACAAAGAALGWAHLRAREPAPVRLLRAAHTGSVNDYAAYAVAGMLAVIAVLTLT
jgi:multicomponent Na+:H+ antiporter subunit D